MAPDLNSLSSPTNAPPSGSPLSQATTAPQTMRVNTMNNQTPRGLSPHQNGGALTSPSPRSGSISLQAAATLNAGLQRSDPDTQSPQNSPSARRHSMSQSPTANRRLSQVLHNLNVADPSLPPPGEMVSSAQPSFTRPGNASPRFSTSPLMLALGGPPESPYAHNRAPSLGELHQELENEQEFQVNRLLHEIRRLQIQVQSQQQGQGQSAVATDEASDSSASGSASQTVIPEPVVGSVPRSPGLSFHPRASFDAARAAEIRRRSRTPSHGASPRFRAASVSGDSGEQWILGGRDESAFYQAETQMLTRENQMLRHRIRDLERQFVEVSGHGNAPSSHEPSHASHLNRSTSVSDEDAPTSGQQVHPPLPTVTASPKEE